MGYFKFLDLPAEMRNRIYEEALTHNRLTDDIATPALLRTCKQVYSEARDILYDRSTLTLAVNGQGTGPQDAKLVIKGDILRTSRSSDLQEEQEKSNESPDKQLIVAYQEVGMPHRIVMTQFLYNLVCWTMQSAVEQVTVFVGMMFQPVYDTMLSQHGIHPMYPIAKIPVRIKLHLNGLSRSVQDYIAGLRSSTAMSETARILSWNGIKEAQRVIALIPDLEALEQGRPYPEKSLLRFKSTLLLYVEMVLGTYPLFRSARSERAHQVAAECLEELMEAAKDTKTDVESKVFKDCWAKCKAVRIVRD